jgi:hypothetical protein
MNNIKTSDETYIAAKAILESQITEAGASVFIVSGLIDYEGGRVLGAYSTISAAKQARDAYIARVRADVKNSTYNNSAFDDYSIEEKPLNAPIKGFY